jgi:transcription antitermination factor NusG
MISKSYHWHAIKTKSRHEFKVVDYLTKAGIECFCPSGKETRIRKTGPVQVTVPFFSLYVFVRSSNREYYDILHYHSVVDFVRISGDPTIVCEEEIKRIKRIGTNGQNIKATRESFRKGKKVIIQSGYFTGLEGEIVDHRGKKKILVRFTCVDYNILVGIECLTPIKLS